MPEALPFVMLAVVLAPQLVLIAIGDFKGWRISNKANAALAATYLVFAAFLSTPGAIVVHAAFAAVMFALMLYPFARGWLGGGDVKFLAAAFLWTGPECASVFGIAMLPPMIVYLILARMGAARARKEGRLHRVPFGPVGVFALAVTLVLCQVF